jgi:hypothetical protein
MTEDFFLADNFYELRKSTSVSNLSTEIESYDIYDSIENQISFFTAMCTSLDIKTQKIERKKYNNKRDLRYHVIDFLRDEINDIIDNITYVVEFSSIYYNRNPADNSAGWDRTFYFYVENLTMNKCKINYQ